MKKKIEIVIIAFLCTVVLILTNDVLTEASTSDSEITAGVTVDYMGKLQMVVREKKTLEPIEGASVELYVKGVEKYVLFGMTDDQGIFTIDITYEPDKQTKEKTAEKKQTNQTILEDNQIKWKVYKKGYLKYPEMGETLLDSIKVPYVMEVYLTKEEAHTQEPSGGNGTGDGAGSSGGILGTIIKTGDRLEMSMYALMVIGGLSLLIVIRLFVGKRKEKADGEKQKE